MLSKNAKIILEILFEKEKCEIEYLVEKSGLSLQEVGEAIWDIDDIGLIIIEYKK